MGDSAQPFNRPILSQPVTGTNTVRRLFAFFLQLMGRLSAPDRGWPEEMDIRDLRGIMFLWASQEREDSVMREPFGDRLLVGAALLCSCPVALAGDFCVATPSARQGALNPAAGNGADHIGRIVQGTYVGNLVYASTQPDALTVEGV
jgi:hypothetical protein